MTQDVTLIKVFISTPGDLEKVHIIIRDVLDRWNRLNSIEKKVVLQAFNWKDVPPAEGRPQGEINKLLIQCDILVVVFWTRYGSDTGEYPSGTIEEFETFERGDNKLVMLYFYKKAADVDDIDVDQLTNIRDFKERIGKTVFYREVKSEDEFKEKLHDDLTVKIRENLDVNKSQDTPALTSTYQLEQEISLEKLIADYEGFLQSYEKDWISERDSNPRDSIGGNRILARAKSFLQYLLSEFSSILDSQQLTEIKTELVNFDAIELQHSGDRSTNIYKECWVKGDEVLGAMKELYTSFKMKLKLKGVNEVLEAIDDTIESWTLEKESEPANTDKGSNILINLQEEVEEFIEQKSSNIKREKKIEIKTALNFLTKVLEYGYSEPNSNVTIQLFFEKGSDAIRKIKYPFDDLKGILKETS